VYRTARTTPASRLNLLREAARLGVSQAARNFCVSRNTVYRWRRRNGDLADRVCRPHRSPRRTAPEREAALLAARLELRWGPDRLGPYCGLSRRTAYRILRRFNAHRLRELLRSTPPPRGRFLASEPGEVVQVDIKSLGRLVRGGGKSLMGWTRRENPAGWQHAHVALDAASRAVYLELLPTLRGADCAAFLERALASFDARGIRVRRVLTDNGPGYRRGGPFDRLCTSHGLRHTLTKPYHPWTNGRVERFIGTLQRECLYAGAHFTSDEERRYAIALWLAFYHSHRPHTALGGLSPNAWLRARSVTKV
jgi:transposase InsO family protein